MSTRIGTCHFLTFGHAVDYYKAYGCSRGEVLNKLDNKEIAIGEPSVDFGKHIDIDADGRYHIGNFDKLWLRPIFSKEDTDGVTLESVALCITSGAVFTRKQILRFYNPREWKTPEIRADVANSCGADVTLDFAGSLEITYTPENHPKG